MRAYGTEVESRLSSCCNDFSIVKVRLKNLKASDSSKWIHNNYIIFYYIYCTLILKSLTLTSTSGFDIIMIDNVTLDQGRKNRTTFERISCGYSNTLNFKSFFRPSALACSNSSKFNKSMAISWTSCNTNS